MQCQSNIPGIARGEKCITRASWAAPRLSWESCHNLMETWFAHSSSRWMIQKYIEGLRIRMDINLNFTQKTSDHVYLLSWRAATTNRFSAWALGWTSTNITRRGTPGWASPSLFRTGIQHFKCLVVLKNAFLEEWACPAMGPLWQEVKWPLVPWVLGPR